MKWITVFLILILFSHSILFAQEERKVLVEVFTNSHCPLCPAAHNVLNNYLAGPNGDKISYVYYHMVYPYADDSLYYQSMEGSDERNNYYSPVPATPQGWFDGVHQGSSTGWAATLDNLVSTQSPLKILLSGTRNETQFNINAELTRTGDIADHDLVIHFVVVEDLYYAGRNGIANHKHVMRKMLPSPVGQPFTIDLNETKDIPQTIFLDPLWDADSLSVVVFVQSTGAMTVYQSETINYDELSITGVENEISKVSDFKLEQNYPNPFNLGTTINFSIPEASFVSLKIFNSVGEEIRTLVAEKLSAGSYKYYWNAEGLTSGIYFYKIKTGRFIKTKKMILMK
ncbi:MAG: T9SS type A sorting domain-containing protein [Ignavibacteriaceae bacterium]